MTISPPTTDASVLSRSNISVAVQKPSSSGARPPPAALVNRSGSQPLRLALWRPDGQALTLASWKARQQMGSVAK